MLFAWQPWKTKNNDIENDIVENVKNPDEKIDFDNVMLSDNTNDFRKYLIQYPDGNYTEEVQNKLNKLENDSIENAETIQRNNKEEQQKADQASYNKAKKTNTKKAYQKYLTDYPTGQYVIEAKDAINDIELINRINKLGNSLYDSRDGKTYKTVKIGNQTWLAKNLAYKPSSGNYWAFNLTKYGYLYDWETAKKVCPNGWHLPSESEWTTLTNYLGGENVAGGKLKATNTWKSPNNGATNSSGFLAFPGGFRNVDDGAFGNVGSSGRWWSATQSSGSGAWSRKLSYRSAEVSRYNGNTSYGFSVRCLMD